MPTQPPKPPQNARALCSRCQRPLRSCLCGWARPTPNRVPVLVLQHPAESSHAKGSARLLGLSLQDCHCVVGQAFEPADLSAWLVPGTALLYPSTAAAGGALTSEPVQRLVVLDGTWRQSRQLLRHNPWLLALPRVRLQHVPCSQYVVRKAERPGQLSTLEATCLALGQLENQPERYAPLLQGFTGWVQTLQTATFRA